MSGQAATTLLLDYTQDKIAVLNESGAYTYVNEAATSLLGFTPEELRHDVAFEYVHPADRDRVVDTFERIVDQTDYAEGTVRYRHRTADDDWIWFESRLSNLTHEALAGYVVSSRDITDRVEAEAQRDQSQLRLQEISERTSEVLWMFDADWSELLFCNEMCANVYGMSVADLEADPTVFLDCIHPDDVPAVKKAMERLSSGESVDMEYRVNPNTDFSNWVWIQGEPIVEEGEVVRIAGFTRDITDRRRRERQLAVMDNLLRHNLRNEMNAIISNAELIEDAPADDPGEKAAVIRRVGTDLIETAEKQREIISLLKEPPSSRPIALDATAADAAQTLGERYPEATIETDLHPVEAMALEQTELAILELLENALQHAEVPAPTATLQTRREGDHATLTVSDNCPPIPEDEYQVLTGDHEMTATYHSSGLGIWLVYWIVDLAGGDVDFARRETGNVATIRLPAVGTT